MNTIEALQTRRSIRTYLPKPVDRSLLSSIVDAARFAPSWKNTQTTRYIIVDDPALKDRVATECCQGVHNEGIIKQAPVLVATTMVRNRSGYERDGSFSTKKEKGWQMFDNGIAAQSFCLAAHEYGLGTLIMGIFDIDKASEILAVPEDQEIAALIAVGYTEDKPDAPKRKSVEELVSFR